MKRPPAAATELQMAAEKPVGEAAQKAAGEAALLYPVLAYAQAAANLMAAHLMPMSPPPRVKRRSAEAAPQSS